jgi:hypothetical protein
MRSAHVIVVATLLVTAVACSGKDPYDPGMHVGTFHVEAALASTTCGATPNPWQFEVRLNADGSTLYWIQGGAPVSARMDGAAGAQLTSGVVQEVRGADPKARRAACSIARTDLVALSLATADAEPAIDPLLAASFAGTLVYTFAPTQGSDCADQVASAGGGFDALPCEVRYDLSGTRAP